MSISSPPARARRRPLRPLVLPLVLLSALLAPTSRARAQEEEADPAEVTLGERLFLETRFAEFFATHAGSDVNAPLPAGDPAVDETATPDGGLPGPFAGTSINCRSCHLVDEQLDTPGGGMRTYTDFARRSPVPAREDGALTTVRNSPPLVNSSLPRPGGVVLHFDGEFDDLPDLVRGTLSGRNYGWLPGEAGQAFAQVARVVREDDGSGALAQDFGGLSYATVLSGTDPAIPAELRLPPAFRVDVATASDRELVDAVAALIAAYTEQLLFAMDDDGRFVGSPFDRFLERNALPAAPAAGESDAHYVNRLRRALARLEHPVWVDEGPFAFHPGRRFVFGPEELAGLEVFLADPPRHGRRRVRDGVGNCAACHVPPAFTDFSFRNTGVSQLEYDEVHGSGRFARLRIPHLRQRNRQPERWLPATGEHPHAAEPFRRVPSAEEPLHADLGLWNVFGNPDMPAPQAKLYRALCERRLDEAPPRVQRSPLRQLAFAWLACRPERLLEASVATFKTPGLRDLGHSAPYMHDGRFDSLEDVLRFYQRASELARRHRLRNGDAEIARIRIDDDDVATLAAFLRALDEDYE